MILTSEPREWNQFDNGNPAKQGYYRVRDHRSSEGTAYMNRNRTWTLIDGDLKKPLNAWTYIR